MLCSSSMADVPMGNVWKNSLIDIYVETPPALLYVQDSQGRRTGGDPKLTVSSSGYQGEGDLSGLKEIPLSSVEQTNISNDSSEAYGQPQAVTGWTIHILDGGSQTYTLNLLGLADGQSDVFVTGFSAPKSPSNKFKLRITALVVKNSTTQIAVMVDPSRRIIEATRIVDKDSLLRDGKAACGLSFIPYNRVCGRLMEKAADIQDALEHHCNEKAEALIRSFLYSLGDSRQKGCMDRDEHLFVKEPALSILKEDARALLNGLKKDGRHRDERDCREENGKGDRK